MNLGSKIRELRKSCQFTQEQLAASLNVTPQAVSKWEMNLSYPDMSLIPVLAGFFNVSLDTLFDYDMNNIGQKIDNIILEHKNYFWNDFEKAEQILLDGLKLYPASDKLKTELAELYSYNIDRENGSELIEKVFDLTGEVIHGSNDVFCVLRAKEILAHIYSDQDNYDEIKKIVESLPYIYPYMIPDRMRQTVSLLKGADRLMEAANLKVIEWQELFLACYYEGKGYCETENYEAALASFEQERDVIERFMLPEKSGYEAYPIGGTHANHAGVVLSIAGCKFKLGQTNDIDKLIRRAKEIYFGAYNGMDDLWDPEKNRREMLDYFPKMYSEAGLDGYKQLDMSDVYSYMKW